MSHRLRTGMLQRVPKFPTVIGLGQVAVEHEGIAFGPLSVELWDDEVIVRIAGVPSTPDSQAREREFSAAHREWAHKVARAQQEGQDWPLGPEHPLGEVRDVLKVTLADDQGTSYRWRSSGWGGVTWEFTGEARFQPSASSTAAELWIGFAVAGTEEITVRVPLKGHS